MATFLKSGVACVGQPFRGNVSYGQFDRIVAFKSLKGSDQGAKDGVQPCHRVLNHATTFVGI